MINENTGYGLHYPIRRLYQYSGIYFDVNRPNDCLEI